MLTEIVSGLIEEYPYGVELKAGLVKVELRRSIFGPDLSLLTSESRNPIGYLDFGHSRDLDHANVQTERGHLAMTGYVLDGRFSYHPNFDEVKDGFKGHSSKWGFFINEQYRGQEIGQLMFSIALRVARELNQPRPLTQEQIDTMDWDYLGMEPPKPENHQPIGLKQHEAFFMVYRMVSKFYPKYFRNGSNSLRAGVEFYNAYSDFSSALVFPDFEIPSLSGIKRWKKLEIT